MQKYFFNIYLYEDFINVTIYIKEYTGHTLSQKVQGLTLKYLWKRNMHLFLMQQYTVRILTS